MRSSEQVASPVSSTAPHQAATGALPAPAVPAAAGVEGAVDPNMLQNLLTQLQAPQQQAQVCLLKFCRQLAQLLLCRAAECRRSLARAVLLGSCGPCFCMTAGATLLTLTDFMHALQAQPWQGVPGLLQTLQLTQLLNQPHNPQAPNLAMLLGSQLANAGGAAAPQGHQTALQQVCCSPGVAQHIPLAD